MRCWPARLKGLCLLLLLSLSATVAQAQDLNRYIAKGDRSFQARDYAAAARTFGDAAKRFPGEPIPRLARGHALFGMRKYAAASRSLQDGIRLFPLWSRSGIDLPGFFRGHGNFTDNMADLSRRVNANPNDPDILFLLAYCLHFSGKRTEAQTRFRRLLDLAPGHKAARTFIDVAPQKPRRFWPGGKPI